MASRLQAIKSVTRVFGKPSVKPATQMGLTKGVPSFGAPGALAVTETAKAVAPAVDHHPWGVHWPGHADKWGAEEPPYVDFDEIKESLKMWKIFDAPLPMSLSEMLVTTVGAASQVVASRMPKGGH
eukprot:TRINITY_DN5732_c0_g1_i2.p2 TRINITY_DN5732_c0_g1~~TRINITY_DN5732_c0_g1_i2.p2  ORF type:complete len:126 (-),score=23.92 TRINITY_DN5732_c0_g1_i2:86-463(-)